MKTIFFITTLLLATAFIKVQSQVLENTMWIVQDETPCEYYFHFGVDTIFFSDSISLFNHAIAVYQEDQDELIISDLFGDNHCSVEDTGTYNFRIENDTLYFTLINDVCAGRVSLFTEFHWSQLITGTQRNPLLPVRIFPNPASDNITVEIPYVSHHAIMQMFNSSGQQFMIEAFDSPIQSVDISNLPPGLYFVRLSNDKTVEMGKFVKR